MKEEIVKNNTKQNKKGKKKEEKVNYFGFNCEKERVNEWED